MTYYKKIDIMNKYILFIFLFCIAVYSSQAQESCEEKLKKTQKLLKNPTPFGDKTMLFSLIEPCALQGNTEAENYIGMFYIKGLGVEKDIEKAFSFISKSANKGNSNAQYNLGRLYKYGLGCEIDFNKAVEWFEKGSTSGSQKAAYALGYMYYKGFGVEQDYSKAVYWFERSIDPMAQHFLGLCYYLGYGVPANEAKALEILLDNHIINSRTLVNYIRAEQKANLNAKTQENLNTTDPESNPIVPEVVEETQNELEYYPEEVLELKDIKGAWKGKLVQYDWSGKHIERVMPITITIEVDEETEIIQVNSQLENQELSSNAIWQDETLYLEDLTQILTLNRLYPEQPNKLSLDYNLFSASLQKKYKYQAVNYLIGYLDTYIPEWTEYGKPMSLVLKPEGTERSLDEEAILALAAQEDQFIKLYPVPFNERLTVQYQLETDAQVYVELISLNGTNKIEILPITEQKAGNYTYSIPVDQGLPEGLYVVRIQAGDKLHTRMIIKDN